MELLYEAVIYFPVVCARGIFPVDIHAVKVIFFHECGYLIGDLFPVGCHINIDSVVTVSPCAVGKCGNYKLYSMTLILTIGDYLLELGYPPVCPGCAPEKNGGADAEHKARVGESAGIYRASDFFEKFYIRTPFGSFYINCSVTYRCILVKRQFNIKKLPDCTVVALCSRAL